MEIGDDFLPELDFDFEEQEEEKDEVVDDKVVNDEIPEEDEDASPDDDSEDESSDNVDTDDNAVAAFNYYKDNNFLTIDHEFDGTFDSLKEALDKQAQVSLVSAIQNFPPFLQPIIEYATLKDDVTPEEVANFLMQYQPPSFTEQDLQNDNDLAENYLTNSLKAEGLDDEEIEDDDEAHRIIKYSQDQIEIIKGGRNALGLTQKELAHKISTSLKGDFITDIENGKSQFNQKTFNTIKRILKIK